MQQTLKNKDRDLVVGFMVIVVVLYVSKLHFGWLYSIANIVCVKGWLVLNFCVLLYIRLKIAWIRYGIKTKMRKNTLLKMIFL